MAKKRSTPRAKRAAGNRAQPSSTPSRARASAPDRPAPAAVARAAVARGGGGSGAAGSGVTGASAQKARLRSRQARDRKRNALLAGAVAALVVGLVAFQVLRRANLPGERFASQGNIHLTSLTSPHPPYNSDPPTSGWHMPGLAPWGTHDRIVEDEYLVHNLEDGGVVIYYPMGTPEENERAIDAVRAVAAPYRNVVIAPRENLPNAYVFTAWQRLQRFDAIDEAAMGRFLEAYEGIDHHVPGIG